MRSLTARRRVCLALVVAQLYSCALPALAAPTGATVRQGDVTIDGSTANLTRIVQGTDKAIVDWQGFGSAANEAILFQQPGAGAAILNRVTGNQASVLAGSLAANGKVFLINPSGILFQQGSTVDVGSFMASTLSLSDDDFVAGRYNLDQDPSRPLSAVVNRGRITAADGGSVALVAPVVSNEGEIVAALGKVVLGAATHAVLSFDGEGLINLTLPTGQAGDVEVPAEMAGDALREAVRRPDFVEGGEVVEENGRVFLKAAEGLALNTGTLSAPGRAGQRAGQVKIDSTRTTILAPGSLIAANGAGEDSSGGSVIALSDGKTALLSGARAEAHAGDTGDGGYAEISGTSQVGFRGTADVSPGPGGAAGTLLIDPTTITIVNGGPGAADDAQVNNGAGVDGQILFTDGVGVPFTISEVALETVNANTNMILQADGAITLTDLADDRLGLATNNSLLIQTRSGTFSMNVGDTIRTQGTGGITIQVGIDTAGVGAATLGLLLTADRPVTVESGQAGGAITFTEIDAGLGAVRLVSPTADVNPNGTGTNRITADSLTVIAATGFGNATQVVGAARVIDARVTAGGAISIANAFATPVNVARLETPTGAITYAQTGTGPATFASVFTGAGAVSLTVDGGLTVAGPLTAGGAGGTVTLDTDGGAGGAVRILAPITAGGAVDIDAATLIESTGGGTIVSGGLVDMDTTAGDIVIGGAVTSGGGAGVTMTVLGSDITVNAPVTSAADITIDSDEDAALGGFIRINATLDATTTITLNAETDITSTALGAMIAQGTVTLRNTGEPADDGLPAAPLSGNITIGAPVRSDGANIVIDATALTGNGGFVRIDATLDALTTVTITSENDITTTADINAGGAVTITNTGGPGDFVFGGAIKSGAGVSITATGSDITVNAPITSAAAILLDADDDAALGGFIRINATLDAATTIELDAETDITSTALGAMIAQGTVTLRNTGEPADDGLPAAPLSGNITIGAPVRSDGANIVIDATALTGNGGFVRLDATLDALTTITIASQSDITVSAAVRSGTALGLDATNGALAGGAIRVDAPLIAGTTLGLTADTGIRIDSTAAAGGAVTGTTAAGDIDISGRIDGVGAVTLAATAGRINGPGDVESDASVSFTAASGIGGDRPIGVTTPVITATTTNGDIVLESTNVAAVTVTSATVANTGNVRITHSGSGVLTLDTVTVITAGSVSATSTGSNLQVLGTGITVAAGNVTLQTVLGGTVVLDAPTTITGAGGTITITSADDISAQGAGGLLTANNVALAAQDGIGTAANPIALAAARVRAVNDTSGDVQITTATAAAVVVEELSADGTGNLAFTQTGAGGFSVDTVSAQNGTVTLTDTGAGAASVASITTVNGAVSVAGAGGALTVGSITTLTDGTITLTGTDAIVVTGTLSTGDGDAIAITSTAGSITIGGQASTSGTVNLTAATGIDANVSAGTLTATNAANDIVIDSASAGPVAATLANTDGTNGNITLRHTGSGPLTIANATTADGAIGIQSTGSDLIITALTAATAGTAPNVTLRTLDAGDIVLNGAVTTALTGTMTVDAADAITGAGTLTAGTLVVRAGQEIGSAAVPLATAAAVIGGSSQFGGITITNTVAAGTVVNADLVTGAGPITFLQTGGADVAFGTALTAFGSVTLTDDVANLTIAGAVTAGGASSNANITAGGAIAGGGLLTADNVVLNAANGIGEPTLLNLSAATVSAINGTAGRIQLANTRATETRVDLLTNGTAAGGSITFLQSGGGDVTFDVVTTTGGDVTLQSSGGDLVAEGPITAGGAGDMNVQTIGSGDIIVSNTLTADLSTITLVSAGAIEGAGPITGGTVDLTAARAIGAEGPVGTAATTLRATAGDDLVVTNTSAAAVTVQNLAAAGDGDIVFTAAGAGGVTLDNTATAGGDITVRSAAADVTIGTALTAGGDGDVVFELTGVNSIVLGGTLTATGDRVELRTAGDVNGAGRVTADTVVLDAGTGVGDTTQLNLTAARISADTDANAISIASASATPVAVDLLNVTGAGAITLAHTGGGALTLSTVSAVSGAVTVSADGRLLVNGPVSTGAGAIALSSSGGDLDVAGDVTAGGVANITLTTTNAGDVTVGGEVTAAGDTVTVSSVAAIDGPGRITAATVALTAGSSIGTVDDVVLAATSFSATAANGNIAIDSVSGALVTATNVAATAGGIDVDHTGGGPITFGTVTTGNGSIALSSTGGTLTVGTSVLAGGAQNVLLETILAGDVILTGTTNAAGDVITVRSAAGINGGGRLTAARADLDAAAGIGNATAINVSAATVSADSTGAGGVVVASNLATPVTVSSLTTAGAGSVTLTHAGGGGLLVDTVRTADGAVLISSSASRVTIDGPITTGNAGNITLETLLAGNLLILGPMTAGGATATIRSAGSIQGQGLISASAVNLSAVSGMGTAVEPLNLAATAIAATNTGGGSVLLNNTEVDPVTVNLLSANGPGDVQFIQRGGANVTFGLVSAPNGSARLSNLSATGADLNLGTVIASSDADITSSSGDIENVAGVTNITAMRTRLFAGRGIGTGAALRTAVRELTADAENGSIDIEQGGAIDITHARATDRILITNASGNMRLGELLAGASIELISGGSILTLDPALVNVTTTGAIPNQRSSLIAAGVIGDSCDEPVRVNIQGELALSAAGAVNGVSIDIDGTIEPSGTFILLTDPPGLVLFNCRSQPGRLQQEIDRANPALAFLPFGFALTSEYQNLFDRQLELSGELALVRTRGWFDPAWSGSLAWDDGGRAETLAFGPADEPAGEPEPPPPPPRRARPAVARAPEGASDDEDEEAPPQRVARRPAPPRRPAPARREASEEDEESRDERIARLRAAAEERLAKLEAKRRAAERAADAQLADATDPDEDPDAGVF